MMVDLSQTKHGWSVALEREDETPELSMEHLGRLPGGA